MIGDPSDDDASALLIDKQRKNRQDTNLQVYCSRPEVHVVVELLGARQHQRSFGTKSKALISLPTTPSTPQRTTRGVIPSANTSRPSAPGLDVVRLLDPYSSLINTYPNPFRPGVEFDPEAARQRKSGYDIYSFFARKRP
jgi:hypothetical protein